jgi:catechol 2,3-dioxygenase-like lactoylglutathione lyase family enzyme
MTNEELMTKLERKQNVSTMKLVGLDHVALTVADLESAADWYVEVLGFERLHQDVWGDVPTFVGTGGTGLALFPKEGTSRGKIDDGIRHVAFRTTRAEFLKAQHELKERNISFHFDDHEISHSIYFHDPDGNRLEITTYEIE